MKAAGEVLNPLEVADVEALVTRLAADAIGYPVLVRPSYVLGGRAMEIVQGVGDLARYVTQAQAAAPGKPILIDKYLAGIEVEVDAICGGAGDDAVLIPGIMSHI